MKSTRSNFAVSALCALAALSFTAACGDDGDGPSDTDTPDFVAAFPEDGLTNRTTTIALTGQDTSWSMSSTLDFGAGVTVDQIMSAGPTSIVAQITIAVDAVQGPRDISVTDSVGTTTLAGGLTLGEPISVAITGNAIQGGAPQVVITNNDVTNPFPAGGLDAEGNPLFGFDVDSVGVFNLAVTSTTFTFLMASDLDAPANTTLTLGNGTVSDSLEFEIAPTTPTPLEVGTPITATLNPFESKVYSFNATDLDTLGFDPVVAAPVVEGNVPLGFVMDEAGSYDSFSTINAGGGIAQTLEPGDTGFLVLFHFAGDAGFDITANVVLVDSILAANTVIEDDANNTFDAAQAIPALPGAYLDGVLNAAEDEDWVSFTVAAGLPAGSSLSIRTTGNGGGFADTVVAFYAVADPATPVAASADAGIFDSLVIPDIAAGDYFVRITPSPDGTPNPATSTYRAILRIIEPPPA